MPVLTILTYPDPLLKEPAEPVEHIDDEIQQLIEDMAETMYQAPGVGLAATQAGIAKRVIVFDPDSDPESRNFQVLINPAIVDARGKIVSENEGCLSVPDFRSDVNRFEEVVVEGLDRHGNKQRYEATGLLATILQHEIDHLHGILFIDRISALKRQIYQRKRKKALKEA
ncbi:MAG: peptide deformylase [Desulfobacterales bacterium]